MYFQYQIYFQSCSRTSNGTKNQKTKITPAVKKRYTDRNSSKVVINLNKSAIAKYRMHIPIIGKTGTLIIQTTPSVIDDE
tara:strand:+ start:192 stop:431 length:240 start_codon:yes stop_codon:yes gene_type:complete